MPTSWFLFMGIAFLMVWLSRKMFDPCCPQCGTRDPDNHGEGCSFK